MKHCKLQNVFRGEESKKENVKIKTRNEKIVETGYGCMILYT